MSDTKNEWPQVVPEGNFLVSLPVAEKTTLGFSAESEVMSPDNTGALQVTTRFQLGTSGNPKGRPKGSRNRFTETFMRTLVDDFATNGASALAALRSTNPEAYLRIVISLLPKSLILKYEESHGISGLLAMLPGLGWLYSINKKIDQKKEKGEEITFWDRAQQVAAGAMSVLGAAAIVDAATGRHGMKKIGSFAERIKQERQRPSTHLPGMPE